VDLVAAKNANLNPFKNFRPQSVIAKAPGTNKMPATGVKPPVKGKK